ncbi:unnamed protein product, partial [Mesorhabditis belari]|uniref:Uncharacterized protein n=1 Tax=Mesorhabditis belari TaxID=2138241 RepID=A0AAF3J1S9_9BILA
MFCMFLVDSSLASTSQQLDPTPTGSTTTDLSGYHRMRLRAHRRRHRLKHTDAREIDELAEMLSKNEEKTRKIKNTETRRERNEELCAVDRETIELNNDLFEFDPPFIEHVRCKNVAEYERGARDRVEEQTCVHGLLRCVQKYAERHVSRRARSSTFWYPYTVIDVPMSCDCMWPVDRYGHLEL